MRKYKINGTNFKVSPLCMGTMTFGTPVKEKEAIELVHYAIDKGINFFDTANMYEGYTRVIGSSGGIAEDILGKAIQGNRDKVIIATKVGMKVGPAPEDENTSPAAIKKQLSLSLKRLNVKNIDIYYLHRPDPVTPIEDILDTIHTLIKEGKIASYGVSNYSVPQLQNLLKIADEKGFPRPVIAQPPLSLLKQDILADLAPLCVKEKINMVPYQILQGGLLTGKYKRNQPIPPNSRKSEKNDWVWELNDNLFSQLENFEDIALKSKLSLTQYAINWVLKQPAVLAAIIGVKTKAQIDEAINAIGK